MTNEQKEEIKKAIEREILITKMDIEDLEETTQPVEPDCSIGRVTRMEAIGARSRNLAVLEETRLKMKRLERAKHHIDSSDFGICISCGEEIPYPRLKFMPHAELCVKCAAK